MEYLNQQPEFLAAVAAMQTIEDFENTVRVGNKILVEHLEEVTNAVRVSIVADAKNH